MSTPDFSQSPLQQRLLALLKKEKEIRARCFVGPDYFSKDLSELEAHHAEVAREIGQVIDRERWPGSLTVGHEGAKAAVELARFCWSEPKFMRRAIPLVEHGYRCADLWGDWFAKLYDTVMYFENKPQVYGTFLVWDTNGKLVPWKIVDPENVSARRDAILMQEINEYIRTCIWEAETAGMTPPTDLKVYNQAMEEWALKRGWKRVESVGKT